MSGWAFSISSKQHDAVGAAADGLGELPALVVAHIARRRAQQAGHRVLLHDIRDISKLAAAPSRCRTTPSASARASAVLPTPVGPRNKHGPHGARPARRRPVRAAADGPGHRRARPSCWPTTSASDSGCFQSSPAVAAPGLRHPLGRHAAGLRHHPGHVLRGCRRAARLSLPLGSRDAQRAARPRPMRSMALSGRQRPGRYRTESSTASRRASSGDAARHGSARSGAPALSKSPRPAPASAPRPAPAPKRRSSAASFWMWRAVLLTCVVAPISCDVPPGQHGLQDAGRVDGALRRARAHDGVDLVDEQNGAAVPARSSSSKGS